MPTTTTGTTISDVARPVRGSAPTRTEYRSAALAMLPGLAMSPKVWLAIITVYGSALAASVVMS